MTMYDGFDWDEADLDKRSSDKNSFLNGDYVKHKQELTSVEFINLFKIVGNNNLKLLQHLSSLKDSLGKTYKVFLIKGNSGNENLTRAFEQNINELDRLIFVINILNKILNKMKKTKLEEFFLDVVGESKFLNLFSFYLLHLFSENCCRILNIDILKQLLNHKESLLDDEEMESFLPFLKFLSKDAVKYPSENMALKWQLALTAIKNAIEKIEGEVERLQRLTYLS